MRREKGALRASYDPVGSPREREICRAAGAGGGFCIAVLDNQVNSLRTGVSARVGSGT